MRMLIVGALLAAALTFTACDAADVFGGGADGAPSPAQEVVDRVEPYVPNGVPRLIFDIAQMGLALTAGFLARRGAKKELREYDAEEYTVEEAESMRAALAALDAKEKRDAAIEKAVADLG